MTRSKEWEALNRIWKTLSAEQKHDLYEDFELVHSAIKKVEISKSQNKSSDKKDEVLKEDQYCVQPVEESMLNRNDVLKLKLDGDFYVGKDSSAYALSNLFGFKLKNWDNAIRTGFPSNKEDIYVPLIELNEISYVLFGPVREIYKFRDFENNRFNEYSHKVMPPKNHMGPARISPGDLITIQDMETEEILRYWVEDSYLRVEITGNRDSFRNYKYKETWQSDANIEAGTISIKAPIIQALEGVRIGNLFEVTVNNIKTKYKLLSVVNSKE